MLYASFVTVGSVMFVGGIILCIRLFRRPQYDKVGLMFPAIALIMFPLFLVPNAIVNHDSDDVVTGTLTGVELESHGPDAAIVYAAVGDDGNKYSRMYCGSSEAICQSLKPGDRVTLTKHFNSVGIADSPIVTKQ